MENQMITRKPPPLERKPTTLKELFREDFSSCSSSGFRSYPRCQSCYVSVRNPLEMDLKTRGLELPKSNFFKKVSVAVLTAVKSLQFAQKLTKHSVSEKKKISKRREDKVVEDSMEKIWEMVRCREEEEEKLVDLETCIEHGGDLNEAVNSHFTERDRNIAHPTPVPTTQSDFIDIDDDPSEVETQRPPFPLSTASNFNLFSLLDPTFQGFFGGRSAAELISTAPRVTHPREVREIPIEFKDSNAQPSHSGLGPAIEDVTGAVYAHGPDTHGTVIIDDDDDDEVIQTIPRIHSSDQVEFLGGHSHGRNLTPSAPAINSVVDYNNDIEEEMIRAAIEASKREVVEGFPNHQIDVTADSSGPSVQQTESHVEDTDIAHAVSLSLKTHEDSKYNDIEQEYQDEEYIRAEEKAIELLKLFYTTEECSEDTTSDLLLDFFRDEILETSVTSRTPRKDELECELLKVSKDWMNGNNVLMDWTVEESRKVHIKEMERGEWREVEEDKKELAMEMEVGLLNFLIDEMLSDLLS